MVPVIAPTAARRSLPNAPASGESSCGAKTEACSARSASPSVDRRQSETVLAEVREADPEGRSRLPPRLAEGAALGPAGEQRDPSAIVGMAPEVVQLQRDEYVLHQLNELQAGGQLLALHTLRVGTHDAG